MKHYIVNFPINYSKQKLDEVREELKGSRYIVKFNKEEYSKEEVTREEYLKELE